LAGADLELVVAFEALPFARDAVAVRRWDDEAKDPAVIPPAFAYLLGDLPEPDQARGVRDRALTATELRTLNATAPPR
jgi:hypothetical protein